MDTLDQVLTVLVLYKMKLEESPAFQSLGRALERKDESGQLFVYDNSPMTQSFSSNGPWQVHYHHDPTNPGVSRGYNQACIFANKCGKKWLLFADQDTDFPERIFEMYSQAKDRFVDCQVFVPLLIDREGLLSPFKRSTTSGKRMHSILPGLHSLNDIQAVNSGLMVSTVLFETAGGYDERLKLDFSDFNFFKKLRSQTSKMVVIDAECRHDFSSSTEGNVNSAMTRFKFYLEGSRVMAERDGGFVFTFRAFLRAVKLSFRYRSVRFIGSFLSGQP